MCVLASRTTCFTNRRAAKSAAGQSVLSQQSIPADTQIRNHSQLIQTSRTVLAVHLCLLGCQEQGQLTDLAARLSSPAYALLYTTGPAHDMNLCHRMWVAACSAPWSQNEYGGRPSLDSADPHQCIHLSHCQHEDTAGCAKGFLIIVYMDDG